MTQETTAKMTAIAAIFAADLENHPTERTLPWQETRDGMTVVVEPKPHWASDMRAFKPDTQEYCSYAEWTAYGARARFHFHISICGNDLIRDAHTHVATVK